jgi:hypothetical protein
MSLAWSAALWVTAYHACRRRLALRADDAWLYGGLIFFSEAIASTMVLGLCGLLKASALQAAGALFLAAHLAAAATAKPRPEHRLPAGLDRWLLVPGAMLAAVAALRLLLPLLSPPDSYDGLSYHLPIAVRWVQQGNLNLAGWYGTERYYAWNGELLTAWLLALDGGSLWFAKAAQTLALPLTAAAGAALGRRLAGRRWSGACAVGLAAVPMSLIQAGVPYVDLLHAAFFAAAASAGVACFRSGRTAHWIAGAAAFGLTLGAKSTLYFSTLVLAAPALAFWLRPERRAQVLRLLPACVALASVLGLGPFVRNWLQTSNPLYPFAFSVAGHAIFRGPLTTKDLLTSMERWFVASRGQWLWYPLHERVQGLPDYTYENGFGPLFAGGWLLWPFAFFFAWRRRDRAAASFLGLLPVAALFFMVLQPVRAPRYIMFAICVPIVGAAYAFKRARGLQLAVARVLWTAGIAWGLLGVVAYLGQSDGPRAVWQSFRVGRPMTQEDYYKRVFLSLGEAWVGVNETLRPGDVVAVNYAELILPWSGMPPRARAVVVHSAPTDYPEAHFAVTADDWLGVLDELGARYAVVWSPRWYPHQGDQERAWIAERPERFKLFGHWESAQMGRTDVYELLKPGLAKP